MALRVLLADESSTIKKVFQLALQDFAVEVKPVNVGLDVAAVAESFKPDIIFADVLLQKKNGYDVSLEIKQNSGLQKTPVVLMWSGFMDLDEDKMQASGADAQLEKPFDVKSLRSLVQSLVPRTQEQSLSSYLSFPKLPDFEEGKKEKAAASEASQKSVTPQGSPDPTPTADWNMESFEPPKMPNADDDFQELSLKPEMPEMPEHSDDDSPLIPPGMDIDKDLLAQSDDSDEASPWEQKDLGKYVVGDDTLLGDDSEPEINYVVPENTDEIRTRAPQTPEPEYDLEIESPDGDGAPSGLKMDDSEAPPPLKTGTTPSQQSTGQERGKTVVLNFSFDGDGSDDEGAFPSGTKVDPNSMLKALNAQLNDEAIAEIIRTQTKEIIEEQTRKVIEDAVWKVLPDLARQIVEREIKKLVDEDEVELS